MFYRPTTPLIEMFYRSLQIKEGFAEGKDLVVSVMSSMGEEQINALKDIGPKNQLQLVLPICCFYLTKTYFCVVLLFNPLVMDTGQTSLTNCVYGCDTNSLAFFCFHAVPSFSYKNYKFVKLFLFWCIVHLCQIFCVRINYKTFELMCIWENSNSYQDYTSKKLGLCKLCY